VPEHTVQFVGRRTLRLHPIDNVVIAARPLAAALHLEEERVTTVDAVAAGHKLATAAIGKGEPVRRYGQIVGFATRPIAPGEHVHLHNLAAGDAAAQYEFGTDLKTVPLPKQPATFLGIRRADGRVATRNYLGVLSTVNCSATVAKMIADRFRRFRGHDPLARWPNVDAVVALTHPGGCGSSPFGEGYGVFQRTLAGYARHPNFAGILVVGLGCEVNQIQFLMNAQRLQEGTMLATMNIQDIGGTQAIVDWGERRLLEMLPVADAVRREPVGADHLIVGLQCGGSDGFSGVTANPALGAAVDLLVAHGGTGVLSESPELFGAQHLLTRRAVSREVADKVVACIDWWQAYFARHVGKVVNTAPGNFEGGLTTSPEKSLGSFAKGGTTNLTGFFGYAEPITAKGFVYMDTPSYDPVSVTGQIAGGATLICFTTGRGSAFGSVPAPCLKLATNTPLYRKQLDDMDINCGDILDGTAGIEETGRRIFERMLAVASGERTKSESFGYGELEFSPWLIEPTL